MGAGGKAHHYMAYRCRIANHGTCKPCGAYVNPNHIHLHVHTGTNEPAELVCNNCYSAIAGSSTIVLQALQAYGLHPNGWEIVKMNRTGQIQILLQGWFELAPDDAPARN